MSTFWKVLVPDTQGGAHKYDDPHIPYDFEIPYDGFGYTVFWTVIPSY